MQQQQFPRLSLLNLPVEAAVLPADFPAAVSVEAADFPAEVLAEAEAAAGNIKKMQRNVAKDCSVPFSYIKFISIIETL